MRCRKMAKILLSLEPKAQNELFLSLAVCRPSGTRKPVHHKAIFTTVK